MLWWVCRDRCGLLEVFQQRAVKAVEHNEMRLVREMFTLSSAASQHLLEKNSGFNWPQENDPFKIRDVHTCCEEINAYNDARLWAVTKFADVLEGPVNFPCNLLYKRIAT